MIYDPFVDNELLRRPQKAIILYVYNKNESLLYDYEIYIDIVPGIYKKVREKDLHPIEE